MSKIAEEKALEAYPFEPIECGGGIADSNSEYRGLYQDGYDQAFQDFLEKAEDAISMISRHYIGEDYTFDQIWEQFKNYMQDEM